MKNCPLFSNELLAYSSPSSKLIDECDVRVPEVGHNGGLGEFLAGHGVGVIPEEKVKRQPHELDHNVLED